MCYGWYGNRKYNNINYTLKDYKIWLQWGYKFGGSSKYFNPFFKCQIKYIIL